jgi:hypothetical protein
MLSTNKKPMALQLLLLILLVGLMAGILSGLVGIGGGIILVPALVYLLSYTQHQAQGTSLGVLTLPVVILGFWQYYQQLKGTPQPIDLKVIGILAIGFVLGGYLGSKLALRIDREMLRRIFGLVLLYTAIKMLGVDTYLINQVKKIF